MSIKIMSQVWDQSSHKGSNLLLLLAIADNANDDGVAYPGQKYLANKIRMTDRSVRRIIDELVASGELEILEQGGFGPKDTTRYQITLPTTKADNFSTIAKVAKADTDAPKVDMGVQKGGQGCPPNHQLTVIEPSENSVSSETDGDAVSASDFVSANQPEEPDLGGDPELTPFALASAVMAEVGVDLARLPASAKGKQLAVAKRLISDDMDIAEGVAIARWLLRDNFWRDKGIDLFVVESNRMKYIAATAARNMPKSATSTGDPFEEIRVGGMKIQRGVVEQAKRKFDWYSAAVDAGFMGVTQEHVKAMQSGGKLVEVFPRDIAVQINRKLIHHIRQFDAVSRV